MPSAVLPEGPLNRPLPRRWSCAGARTALGRLLVRLMTTAPNRWALKGGLALDTRLGARARVSLDLDAEHAAGIDAARMDLQRAAAEDVGFHATLDEDLAALTSRRRKAPVPLPCSVDPS